MNFIKRSFTYVSRKKIKTLLLFLLLLCMSTAMLSSFYISDSTKMVNKNIAKDNSAGIYFGNNRQNNPGTARGGGTLKGEDIEKIRKISGLKKEHYKRILASGDIQNGSPFTAEGETLTFEEKMMYGNLVDVHGVNSSKVDARFTNKTFYITKGRHIKEKDKNTLLVHERLAKKNKWKVGDIVNIKGNPYIADNVAKSERLVKMKIVGLFGSKAQREGSNSDELYENTVISDLLSASQLYNMEKGKEIYCNAMFFPKNYEDIEKIIEKAQGLDINWNDYSLYQSMNDFAALNATVGTMEKLIRFTLILTIVVSLVVLLIVMILTLKERKKESGILLSLGVEKRSIIFQYIFENMVIFIGSAAASLVTARFITEKLAGKFLTKATEAGLSAVSSMGNIGADAESTVLQKTIDHIDIVSNYSNILYVILLGGAVILTATTIASFMILRKPPRDIILNADR